MSNNVDSWRNQAKLNFTLGETIYLLYLLQCLQGQNLKKTGNGSVSPTSLLLACTTLKKFDQISRKVLLQGKPTWNNRVSQHGHCMPQSNRKKNAVAGTLHLKRIWFVQQKYNVSSVELSKFPQLLWKSPPSPELSPVLIAAGDKGLQCYPLRVVG